MLPRSTQEKSKEILSRIAKGVPVTLKERLFIQNIAIDNEKVSCWLKRASRLQQGENNDDGIDNQS